MYQLGHGVEMDFMEATKWYRLAAEQGNAEAQNSLGLAFFYGLGVKLDHTEAVKWLGLAAKLAQDDLAKIDPKDRCVVQDAAKVEKGNSSKCCQSP